MWGVGDERAPNVAHNICCSGRRKTLFNGVARVFRIPGLTGDPIPVSHRVAVIGLPRSGKTTLITALFELIQRGSDIPNVRLHGLNTISTVNRYIASLNAGEKIG